MNWKRIFRNQFDQLHEKPTIHQKVILCRKMYIDYVLACYMGGGLWKIGGSITKDSTILEKYSHWSTIDAPLQPVQCAIIGCKSLPSVNFNYCERCDYLFCSSHFKEHEHAN